MTKLESDQMFARRCLLKSYWPERSFWIGLKRHDDQWIWNDRTALTDPENWAAGQPTTTPYSRYDCAFLHAKWPDTRNESGMSNVPCDYYPADVLCQALPGKWKNDL